jgi:hypothetical protein
VGLFDVHILFEDAVNTNVAKKEVLDNVKARLMSNRNLCQDFVDITTVQNRDMEVRSTVLSRSVK